MTTRPRGERHVMVAMELMMSLYTPLFAFPQMPTTLQVDDQTQWQEVATVEELRAVLEELLQASPVLGAALAPGQTADDITLAAVGNPVQLSRLFGLGLYDDYDPVPITCRQMFEAIAAVYNALRAVNLDTRAGLQETYYRYQAFPGSYKLPGLVRVSQDSASNLLQFCKELTVDWLQPYVAASEDFYFPPGGSLLRG